MAELSDAAKEAIRAGELKKVAQENDRKNAEARRRMPDVPRRRGSDTRAW